MVSTLAADDQETLRYEHGGTVEAAGLKVAERLVGGVQRVGVDGHRQRVFGGEGEEVAGVPWGRR